jgi:5-methyltetrahydropteroyltriglutamate--homocysteine methyltransferase
MTIPTEPIGSIPQPLKLIDALTKTSGTDPSLDPLYEDAIRDTIKRFESMGSSVITDGGHGKYHKFGTDCVNGATNIAPDGFTLPSVRHVRRWPWLTAGPLRYRRYASRETAFAKIRARVLGTALAAEISGAR